MRRKKRKKRIGISVLSVLVLFGGCVAALAGEEKKGREKPFAVVGGTVFREPGFALPGAEVLIEAASPGSKFKRQKAVSDARGEFAFRVPPGEATYKLTARARGHEVQEKTASVTSEEHLDVFFQLKPVPE